jgi:hypothetical protein
MTEALQHGDRVSAKYKGDGTVVGASFEMLDKPHFDDDVCVAWDSGSVDWHGPAILTKLSGAPKP